MDNEKTAKIKYNVGMIFGMYVCLTNYSTAKLKDKLPYKTLEYPMQ